jgi:hypothetical protein
LTLGGTLAVDSGGTGAVNATDARTNLGLGSAAVLDAGVSLGVATLDGGGTVPTSQLPAAVLGAVKYQGTWNASTNTPTLVSSVGTQGHYYVVNVSGSTDLNGITDWQIGDWAIYNGSIWEKIDNTDAVTSVNGYTGTVVLTNTDISGFGTMSTQNANAVAITGGSINGTTIGATTPSTVTGTTVTATTLVVNDNSTLGSSNSDTVTFNARINSDFDPSTNNTYDLGRNSHAWRNLYLTGTANIAALSASGTTTLSGLTASTALALNASKQVVSVVNTGTGDNVLATSPTLVTPNLGTPSTLVGTNITGTAAGLTAGNVTTNANLTGAVTSVGNATSLGSFSSANLAAAVTDETGTGALVFANSPTLVTPALGTPASGVVTNLTGTASININGTVGATTANTGAFTTLSASGDVTLSGGTANGVAFANASKVLTTGSALTFDGSLFGVGQAGYARFTVKQNNQTYAGGIAIENTTDQSRLASYYDGSVWRTTATYGSTGVYYPMAWNINDTEQMRLTSTGLGIGTSSPGAKLEVLLTSTTDSSLRLRYNSSSIYGNHLMNGGGDYVIESPALNGVTSGNFRLRAGSTFSVSTNNNAATSPQLTLDSSGNLGLGVTPSPWSGVKALQVGGGNALMFTGANAYGQFYMLNNAYFNGSNYIYQYTQAAASYEQNQGSHRWYTAPSGTAGNAISFTQAMTLDASGRLLIGTTTSVGGCLTLNATSSGESRIVLKLSDTQYCYFGGYSGIVGSGNPDDVALFAWTGKQLMFGTNATERMRIDSTGNLGLGVTPSAWQSIYRVFQAPGGSSFVGRNDGGIETIATANAFRASTGTWTYFANGVAMRYVQSADGHTWHTAPSGTAGNAISFTQAMTLDASGRLGIGKTNPTTPLWVSSAGTEVVIEDNDTAKASNPNAFLGFYGSDGRAGYVGFPSDNNLYLNNQNSAALLFLTANTERARIDSSGNLLVGATAVGNGGKLYVNGSISLGTSTTGVQSSMAKDTTQRTTSVSTSATTIYTAISSGMSSASAGYFIIYGSDNAGAGFMDVVIAKANGTPVVVSSSTVEGSPPARTYSVSSSALQLTMTSGTYNVNLKATVIGHPF